MNTHFDYNSTENRLTSRREMSPVLRGGLLQVPRDAWKQDPRFRGEPEVWLQIHNALLQASAELPLLCTQLMQAVENREVDIDSRLHHARGLALELTRHAHGHHHIEDHHFFPVFVRAVPSLSSHLALLDGDHRILADVLDDMETITATLPAMTSSTLPAVDGSSSADTSGRGARALNDRLLAPVEKLAHTAERFDTLFRRHIGDEEEICIPIMLRA